MQEWLEQDWWWLLSLTGLVAWVTIRVRLRGGDEALWRRIIYALQPTLDPRRKQRSWFESRAYAVCFLIVLFIIAAMVTLARFNDSQ
jgi:hypothetical protein